MSIAIATLLETALISVRLNSCVFCCFFLLDVRISRDRVYTFPPRERESEQTAELSKDRASLPDNPHLQVSSQQLPLAEEEPSQVRLPRPDVAGWKPKRLQKLENELPAETGSYGSQDADSSRLDVIPPGLCRWLPEGN